MSEKDSEITYQQRVDQHGEVIGTGYLIQRTPTRIYLRKGKPSGMAQRILEYARVGMEKRNGTKKTKDLYTPKCNVIPKEVENI